MTLREIFLNNREDRTLLKRMLILSTLYSINIEVSVQEQYQNVPVSSRSPVICGVISPVKSDDGWAVSNPQISIRGTAGKDSCPYHAQRVLAINGTAVAKVCSGVNLLLPFSPHVPVSRKMRGEYQQFTFLRINREHQ